MKQLVLMVIACVSATGVLAQGLSPIRMTILPVNNRKAGGPQSPALQPMGGQQAGDGQYLRITILNLTMKPLEGVTVRWGILKSMPQHSTTRVRGNMIGTFIPIVAFGGHEILDFKPREEKVFETEFLEVGEIKKSGSSSRSKQKIEGHGVEVYLDGRIVAQQYVGFRGAKYQLEELHPISAANEDVERDNKSKIIPPPVASPSPSTAGTPSVAKQRFAFPAPPARKGLRFDGLYATVDEKDLKTTSSLNPYRQNVTRKGRDYYRFYPDGTAICVHVAAGPTGSALEEQSQSVGKWFARGHRGTPQGRYMISGSKIEVIIGGSKLEGTVPDEDHVLKLGSTQLRFVYIATLP